MPTEFFILSLIKRVAATVCLLLAGQLSVSAGEISDVPWLALDNTRMTRLSEPAFGGEVAVYEAGMHNARQVVLVHGLGQEGSRIWADSFAALAGDFHVIAFDLPGFGASDKGNHPYAPAAYAAVLKAVADATTQGPFMLVGHSMGGAISLSYAAQNPASVQRLVLVDVAGILHRSVYAGYLSRLGLGFLPDVLPRQDDILSALTQTALGSLEGNAVPAEALFNSAQLRMKLLAADPHRIAALGLALQDFSPVLSQIKAPVLLLWGQNDAVAPIRTGRLLASLLHPARLRVIPGAGHSPMLEAATAFHRLLHTELSRDAAEFARMNAEQAYALPRYSETSTHDIDCHGSQEELVLEGDFRHVSVTSCDRLLIRNSHLASLQVEDSRLVVENSHILGLGLRCNDSRVLVTGGSITGVHAVDCQDSEVDLAGVSVKGVESALKGQDTLVYLSVSRLQSPHGDRSAHQVLYLDGQRQH